MARDLEILWQLMSEHSKDREKFQTLSRAFARLSAALEEQRELDAWCDRQMAMKYEENRSE